ncbi:Rpn family recombination-promoting nuclease/putative transposase [Lachnospiraceae bacterium HCP28S3_F9]|nr:Rpn family recombination-promoting nuclease/putative transposase [Blautia obeum]
MGKGNAAVREWMSNPVRFSDLYNGIVFQGKQVVLPEELEPAEGETDILLEDNEQKVQEIHRYRDIVMRWKKGALLVLLACENQEKVHYAMTVRNMLYDSLSYAGQIQQLWKEREKEEKQKMTAPEFLSKWKKDDRLVPVITLVFYYDTEQWDGSTDLHGMLQWGEGNQELLREYVPNYRINLVDAGNLEHLERFQSDLQEILGMLKCRGNKKELLDYMNKRESYFRNVDEETYQVMREFLHSEKMLKENVERIEGKETVDMCKALDELYNDGIEQGIERGMIRGTIETMKEFNISMEEAIERISKKFEITKEQAKEEVEKYWS